MAGASHQGLPLCCRHQSSKLGYGTFKRERHKTHLDLDVHAIASQSIITEVTVADCTQLESVLKA